MNREMLVSAIGQIDDKYIEEAQAGLHPLYKTRRTIAAAAACLVLAAGVIWYQGRGEQGIVRSELSVSAAELGMEEYLFGITLPEVVYFDSEIAILYDYRGIYVYSFLEKALVGFADFRPVDMTCINGEYATMVEASDDGRFVRAYSMPAVDHPRRNFLYDVAKNEFTQVDAYADTGFKAFVLSDVTASAGISDYSATYQSEDGTRIGVALRTEEGPETLRYGDLYIITQKGEEREQYYIFE